MSNQEEEKVKEMQKTINFLIEKNEILQNELKVSRETEKQIRIELEKIKNLT